MCLVRLHVHPAGASRFTCSASGDHALQCIGLYGYVPALRLWPDLGPQALLKAVCAILQNRKCLPADWRCKLEEGS
eukprot:13529297-Alexandrium_andersonii.AAC.1